MVTTAGARFVMDNQAHWDRLPPSAKGEEVTRALTIVRRGILRLNQDPDRASACLLFPDSGEVILNMEVHQ